MIDSYWQLLLLGLALVGGYYGYRRMLESQVKNVPMKRFAGAVATIGNDTWPDESPAHEVELRAFSIDVTEVVVDAVDRVKGANPGARYACDPVMGNARSGCFVDPAIPELIRDRVVGRADLITPNQFELASLTGAFDGSAQAPAPSLDQVVEAATAARAMGPSTVLVTSLEVEGQPAEEIGMLAITDAGG